MTSTYSGSLLPLGWSTWDQVQREDYTRRTGFTAWPDQQPTPDPIAEGLSTSTDTRDTLTIALENALNTPTPTEAEAVALNGQALTDRLTTALNGGSQATAQHIKNNLEIY